jgi:phage tail sheath protein FI
MPAAVSYPGVYPIEGQSGARAVPAASTSVTVFVGMADRGRFERPTQVFDLRQYQAEFGETSVGEMADQVRQYFVNGGGEAWIMRIAKDPRQASVRLRDLASSTDAGTLKITARDHGVLGNMLRVEVDYATASPERTFNLKVFRHVLRRDGTYERTEVETLPNLSMDPASPRYAPTVVEASSALVTATDLRAALAANRGVSIGGVIYSNTLSTARSAVASRATNGSLSLQIGARPAVVVPLGTVTAPEADLKAAIEAAIPGVTVTVSLVSIAGGAGRLLQIESDDGPVVIAQAPGSTAAVDLQLGVAAGGVEMDAYSVRRPALTGIVSSLGPVASAPSVASLDAVVRFGNTTRGAIASFTLSDPANPAGGASHTGPALGGTAAALVFADPAVSVSGVLGTLNAVRSALDELGAAIAAGSANRWRATRQGLRLALVPTFGGANAGLGSTVSTAAGFNVGAANHPFNGADNVAAYSLGRLGGVGGLGVRQASDPADEGLDGTKPELLQYTRAFQTLESTLASWNLMVLPRAAEQSDNERRALWAQAGASCARRRAILLVDPDAGWTTIPAASAGADSIKIGADTRNSAVFWPRLLVPQSGSPAPKTIDPSGSIAGLMARTDGRFGVWTAPAGLEATLRGVSGLSRVMSDEENGVLNPKALNAIRLFPSGVVCWGARMMAGSDDTGNIDDKYIPVRRTMLFIEESLYRGLKFAVFQPNAEPLWASIRLAAGSFMNGLMRQGAFASRNKADAYYVLCDGTTTTETDRNLGIVNVVVAFAPLKPAEFVVLTVQQIAGQVQV